MQASETEQPIGAGGPASTGGPSGPRAGFWKRFAASFTDGIVLLIPILILDIALKGVGGGALSLVLVFAYFTYFEGGPRGQTPGKQLLGIRVVSFDTGGPIGYGRGFIRMVGRYLSAVVIYIGYLWMLWDPEKQCWHDKLASDVVVPISAYPVP
jgi:uncharacterized RDD family membrane protein YckC